MGNCCEKATKNRQGKIGAMKVTGAFLNLDVNKIRKKISTLFVVVLGPKNTPGYLPLKRN
jgi:hypothetical protein